MKLAAVPPWPDTSETQRETSSDDNYFDKHRPTFWPGLEWTIVLISVGDRLVSMLDHKLEPRAVRRVEVITGPGGRRRFADDEKVRIIEEALVPGAVISAVARQNGLTPQQLFTWLRQARRRTEGGRAEASWSQNLADWIASHTRAFTAFGAASALIVSDNLKSGVIRACFYEPEINRSYADMAAHYGAAILPARPYKPRDKAKVEAAVLLVQRWILARLRNRRFFTLEELNAAIAEEVARLNARVSRHLGASRRQIFEAIERPAMSALPSTPYVHADWRRTSAGPDYHVRLEEHHYSIPYELIRQQLWARLTASTVEIFRAGKRMACHRRAAPGDTGYTTLKEHMPASHRRHAEVTPQALRDQASQVGSATGLLVDAILRERPHPEQGFRSCLGILRLERSHGRERLEAACDRALKINARTLSSVNSILQNRLDGRSPDSPPEAPPITHANIRGPRFFH